MKSLPFKSLRASWHRGSTSDSRTCVLVLYLVGFISSSLLASTLLVLAEQHSGSGQNAEPPAPDEYRLVSPPADPSSVSTLLLALSGDEDKEDELTELVDIAHRRQLAKRRISTGMTDSLASSPIAMSRESFVDDLARVGHPPFVGINDDTILSKKDDETIEETRGRVARQDKQLLNSGGNTKQAFPDSKQQKQIVVATVIPIPVNAQAITSCYTCSDCKTQHGPQVRCQRSAKVNQTGTTTTPATMNKKQLQKLQDAPAPNLIVGCAKIVITYPGDRKPSARKKCLEYEEATQLCGSTLFHPFTQTRNTYHCCFDSLCNQATTSTYYSPINRTILSLVTSIIVAVILTATSMP